MAPPVLPTGSRRKYSFTRKRTLHQSVYLMSKRLEDALTDNRWDHYGRLGHCLLIVWEQDDSCTAFERQWVEKSEQSRVHCDSCNVRKPKSAQISSQCFVCSTCTDVDSCPRCTEEYNINGSVEMKCPEFWEKHE